jgi:hypothetical protein
MILSHLIEYVHDSKHWLEKTVGHLKPGERLWIKTLNTASAEPRYFKSNWRSLEPPPHLCFYPKCLAEFMQSIELQVNAPVLPALLAVPVYDTSLELATGKSVANRFIWCRLLRPVAMYLAFRQSCSVKRSEFISFIATRAD